MPAMTSNEKTLLKMALLRVAEKAPPKESFEADGRFYLYDHLRFLLGTPPGNGAGKRRKHEDKIEEVMLACEPEIAAAGGIRRYIRQLDEIGEEYETRAAAAKAAAPAPKARRATPPGSPGRIGGFFRKAAGFTVGSAVLLTLVAAWATRAGRHQRDGEANFGGSAPKAAEVVKKDPPKKTPASSVNLTVRLAEVKEFLDTKGLGDVPLAPEITDISDTRTNCIKADDGAFAVCNTPTGANKLMIVKKPNVPDTAP